MLKGLGKLLGRLSRFLMPHPPVEEVLRKYDARCPRCLKQLNRGPVKVVVTLNSVKILHKGLTGFKGTG